MEKNEAISNQSFLTVTDQFKSNIWSEEYGIPSDEFGRLLNEKNHLIEIRRGTNPIVIGCPHHTKNGVSYMFPGRPGDECVGLVTANIAINLKCEAQIYSHATDHDPNKDARSPYFTKIFDDNPQVLVEIHGCGNKGINDIEISCGQDIYGDPQLFKEKFQAALKKLTARLSKSQDNFDRSISNEFKNLNIGAQLKPGSSQGVRFPATHTQSLITSMEKKIPAYHIELKPEFRKMRDTSRMELTGRGKYISEAIAATIAEMYKLHYQKDIKNTLTKTAQGLMG